MSLRTTGWPPEKRKRVAQKTRADKPWQHSTSPRTAEGKDIVRGNALKHGYRSAEYKMLIELLDRQAEFVAALRRQNFID